MAYEYKQRQHLDIASTTDWEISVPSGEIWRFESANILCHGDGDGSGDEVDLLVWTAPQKATRIPQQADDEWNTTSQTMGINSLRTETNYEQYVGTNIGKTIIGDFKLGYELSPRDGATFDLYLTYKRIY